MPDLLAKGVAVTVAVLLATVVAVLLLSSRPASGGTEVKAEFDDAFPLVEGMHVRVDGAIAGSVAKIEVNDRGNAEVTLNLNDSIEPPMADATAAIRQQDTTGDSYVAFDPGGDPGDPGGDEPLGDDGIVCESHDHCSATLVAPRLDDLLNAFGPSERSGLQLVLVELAKALDRRGADLNRAALSLRPAVEAADEALGEVRTQNRALTRLISSAESVTGQAAARKAALARLIASLAKTVNVTAAEGDPLDAALERLPETTARARTTLTALARNAVAARPLADELAAGAPQLATALDRLPGFLDHASGFLTDTRPTLDLTRRVLRAAEPTLKVGNKRVITGPFDLTGATADLLNSVLGGEDAFPALFGDDSYGEGEGTLGRRGFGSVAVEPGDLSGYPADHADRHWLRVSAVINCEVFGLPVEPGCLADYLSGSPGSGSPASASSSPARRAQEAARVRDAAGAKARHGGGPHRGGRGGGHRGPGSRDPKGPGGSAGGGQGGGAVEIPRIGELDLSKLGAGRRRHPGRTRADHGRRRSDPRGSALGDLLDYLTGDR